jgi:hypothetical protein
MASFSLLRRVSISDYHPGLTDALRGMREIVTGSSALRHAKREEAISQTKFGWA